MDIKEFHQKLSDALLEYEVEIKGSRLNIYLPERKSGISLKPPLEILNRIDDDTILLCAQIITSCFQSYEDRIKRTRS